MNSYKVMALLAVVLMTLSVMVTAVTELPGANGITTTPENTKIQGYVTDAVSNDALVEVEIAYYEYTDYTEPVEDPSSDVKPPVTDEKYWTYTDEKGYYTLSVPQTSGEITFYLKGYDQRSERVKLEGMDSLWLNVTLKELPPPPEPDAVLKGIVTDAKSGSPISDISISLYSEYYYEEERKDSTDPSEPERTPETDTGNGDSASGSSGTGDYSDSGYEYYNTDWAYGISKSNGEYQIELFSGTYRLTAYEDYTYGKGSDYYSYSAQVVVEKNSTTYYNFTMKPLPPRDAYIKGYVTDASTGKPIEYASISIYKIYDADTGDSSLIDPAPGVGIKESMDGMWYGDDYGYAVTDSNGYYELNVRPGTYMVQAGGYYYYAMDDVVVYDETGVPEIGTDAEEGAKATRGEEVSDEEIDSDGKDSYPEPYLDEPSILPPPEDEYYPFSTTTSVVSKGTVWLNISLKPIPPKNSKITGVVKDSKTGEVISNAYISLIGYTQGYQNYYWAEVDSDGKFSVSVREGFYVMTVNHYYYEYDYGYKEKIEEGESTGGAETPPGDDVTVPPVPPKEGSSKRYFPYSATMLVSPSTTVKHDVLLVPYPEESSKLHGKVTDKNTGEALSYVSIRFDIKVDAGRYSKYDYTNEEGEYSTMVPASTVKIIIGSHYAWDYDETVEKIVDDGTTADTKGEVVDEPPAPDTKPTYTRYFGFKAELTIAEDSDVAFDIKLEVIPDHTCTLTGTVLGVDDLPVKYAWVGLIDTSHFINEYSMFITETWTDELGKFKLAIYPGTFGLFADSGWYMAVDGTATSYQQISFDSDNQEKSVTINLKAAKNNMIDLNFKFDSWQNAKYTAEVTLNENAFGFRYYIDNSYGNSDGKIDVGEVEDFITGWIAPLGMTPFGQISVDSVTYHPKPGTEPVVTLGNTDAGSLSTASTDPLGFTIKMDIVPYKRISESAAEHDVELVLNEYIPAEISYRIELPGDFVMTGFSDVPSGSSISGLGGNSVFISSPFNYYTWYDMYAKDAYAERGDDGLDAEEAGNILAGPSVPPPQTGESDAGSKSDGYLQASSEGSNYIRFKVTSEDLKSQDDEGILSGTQVLALTALLIIVVLVIFAATIFTRRRKRPQRPQDIDDRVPQNAMPPAAHRPQQPMAPQHTQPPRPPMH